MTDTIKDAIAEGRARYPDASDEVLASIAQRARKAAEEAEAEGRAEGYSFSAAQSECGCDWQWGDGTTIRDESGRVVIDEDDEPTARVFDCDGNTITLITEESD